VVRIRPQVRQREVLSTDPTGDADARVVEVRLALDPADARRVRSLVGLKTVIRFEP
jgi:HlyD family secretion protein